jgi:hypothetical protein
MQHLAFNECGAFPMPLSTPDCGEVIYKQRLHRMLATSSADWAIEYNTKRNDPGQLAGRRRQTST